MDHNINICIFRHTLEKGCLVSKEDAIRGQKTAVTEPVAYYPHSHQNSIKTNIFLYMCFIFLFTYIKWILMIHTHNSIPPSPGLPNMAPSHLCHLLFCFAFLNNTLCPLQSAHMYMCLELPLEGGQPTSSHTNKEKDFLSPLQLSTD